MFSGFVVISNWFQKVHVLVQAFAKAYKILFLDVLFPMDVPRIIFIDADQVRVVTC